MSNLVVIASRWIARFLNKIQVLLPEDRKYIYVHDLDGNYKLFYLETFNHLPVSIKDRMMK
jgi:hypothetical protein